MVATVGVSRYWPSSDLCVPRPSNRQSCQRAITPVVSRRSGDPNEGIGYAVQKGAGSLRFRDYLRPSLGRLTHTQRRTGATLVTINEPRRRKEENPAITYPPVRGRLTHWQLTGRTKGKPATLGKNGTAMARPAKCQGVTHANAYGDLW
jgi:hypothetical protein